MDVFSTRTGKVYDEKLEHLMVQESNERLKSHGNTLKKHMSQCKVTPDDHI